MDQGSAPAGATDADRLWGLNRHRELFPQAAGRDADHSSPSSADVKNAWSCFSTAPFVSIAWWFIQHSEKFTSLIPWSRPRLIDLSSFPIRRTWLYPGERNLEIDSVSKQPTDRLEAGGLVCIIYAVIKYPENEWMDRWMNTRMNLN